MARERDANMSARCALIFFILFTIHGGYGASNRRKDTVPASSAERPQYLPSPSVETLKELAEAMGAAGFEHYTEGSAKPIVKRLIPENAEPGLDDVSYKGIIGKAGVDFPAYPSIPATSFNCRSVPTGYYADLETDCQVFHICDSHRKISFLCPNGTIFSQSHLICDWWFKVDCASAPALYETSAEQYSQAQKKNQLNQAFNLKTPEQQIKAEASNTEEERQQLRRPNTNPIINQDPIPSSTERHSRYRARPYENITPINNVKATSRSFQPLFSEGNFNNPTQRTYETITSRSSAFEKRRKNLVQLIANNFGQTRTTLPSYVDAATYRSTAIGGDYNGIKEMQEAAESAAFANNNNRQFLQQTYNNINNFKPYPVYSPTPNTRASKSTTPTYTTAFGQEFHSRNSNTKSNNRGASAYPTTQTVTSKRPTLLPYTKVYGNTLNEKHQPYTRPGVYLLKEYIDKEKNKTENQIQHVTERSDNPALKLSSFESVTKIPTSRSEDVYFTAAASSDRYDVFSNQENNFNQISTEPTYYNRRERLSKKFNLVPTAPEPTTNTEKYFGRRPGLIVPPSLTPKTLHSLAIYYATALDNLSTTTENDENQTTTSPEHLGEDRDEELPSILSKHTIEKYSNLFSQPGDHSDLLEEIKLDINGTNDLSDDLMVQQSQGPLSSSPQIRELAQVFTHALSAYLQDPVQFRKVLSDIRPTHPTFGDTMTTSTPSSYTDDLANADGSTTYNEEEDEILGFSDDNKSRFPSLAQLRDAKIQTTTPAVISRLGKALTDISTTAAPFSSSSSTTATEYLSITKSPLRCCGSISASYTTAVTEKESKTTVLPTTNGFSVEINGLSGRNTTVPNPEAYTATTENSYTIPKYGGFQNNTSSFAPYGKGVQPTNARPLNEEQYSESTNLPSQWGDVTTNADSIDYSTTSRPITNSHHNIFEVNNLIKESPSRTTSTYLPTTTETSSQDTTDSESIELENEEELQRAQSQSFVSSNSNNNIPRQGKNIEVSNDKNSASTSAKIRAPSVDLEVPSVTGPYESSTTVQPTVTPYYSPTTKYLSNDENFSTLSSFDDDSVSINFETDKKNTNLPKQQWSNNFDSWHSTVILDPITLNDGLSAPKGFVENTPSDYQFTTRHTYPTDQSYVSTTVSPTVYSRFNTNGLDHTVYHQNHEQFSFTSPQKQGPTSASLTQDVDNSFSKNPTTRGGRLLKTPRGLETSTDATTTIDNNMVEIAKEIIGGLNATTTDKLMNVMKKTKSKTVRRLILLLVQTCDDDHNKTAEASKKALLDALMAVSQKDIEATTTEALPAVPTTTNINEFDNNRLSNNHRRMDRISDFAASQETVRPKQSNRTGKSIRVDPSAVNALRNPPNTPPTTDAPLRTTTESATSTTTAVPVSTTSVKSSPSPRRGVRKFLLRSSPVDTKITTTTTSRPIAEARVLSGSTDLKPQSDTRALELLRSLYTIAARWG